MGLEDKIKKLMEEQRMTQQDLAEKSGVSQATVSRILKKTITNVKRETLDQLASALGVSTAYLLGEEEKAAVKDLFRGLEDLTEKERDLVRGIVRLIKQKKQK